MCPVLAYQSFLWLSDWTLQVAKMWLSKSGSTLQCNENCKCEGCCNCGHHATEDGKDDDEEDAGKSGSDSSAD